MLNHRSEPFARAKSLLKELQDLHAEGKDESAEAERAREEYSDIRDKLPERERRLLRGLSADLYSLSNEELPDTRLANIPKGELARRVQEAYGRGDLEQTLEWMRGGIDAPPDGVAFLRSRCWEKLGDLDVALWFAELAERIAARPTVHDFTVLRLLIDLGRVADASAKAKSILADGGGVDARLLAVHVIFAEIAVDPSSPRQHVASLVEASRSSLALYASLDVASRNPHLGLITASHLATLERRLRPSRSLVEIFEELVEQYPLDVMWAAFGLDVLDEHPVAGERALQQAVTLGARLMWPYRELALRALDRGAFRDAIKHAGRAIQFARDSRYTAELYACLALSHHQLNDAPATIDDLLARARQLDPTSVAIDRAFQFVMSQRTSGSRERAAPPLEHLPGWDAGEIHELLSAA